MNIKRRIKKIRLTGRSQRLKIITVVLFVAVGTYLLVQAQAAAGYIYISPASAGKYVGDTFSVQVRINTTSNVNAAFINMNYNANGLQVTGIARGSDFPNQLEATQHTISGNTGTIKMKSTRNISGSGNLHYATITFKTKTTGSYGITPLSSSELIDYGGPTPFVSYTVAGGKYSVITKPGPAPKPTPAPAPTTKPKATVPATGSAPTPSKLSISDFTITDLGYRSAVISWKTNNPATSKANYGHTSSDMPYEIKNDGKATTHKLVVTGDTIRAGNKYAVRITSDDGAGPATLDGEFLTKGIEIAIKVTDSQNQPVAGAEVFTDTTGAVTGDDGIAKLTVPEGNISISAKKDALKGDVLEEIFLPASNEAPSQTVSVVLGVSATSVTTPAKKLSPLWILGPLIIGGMGLVAAVVFLRRRRQQNDNYLSPSVTILSDPIAEKPVHHATLPELVNEDLRNKRKKQPPQPKDEPEDMFSVLDKPGSPPTQPPPIHPPAEHHDHEAK